jgi:putative transposase
MGLEVYYHVWFSPKNRKWLLQGDVNEDVKRLIQEICRDKDIKLLAYEAVVDHVHLLVEVSSRGELSKAVNLLKGISARKMLQKFPDLKLDAGVIHFWQRRYGSAEVPGAGIASAQNYIKTQWKRLEKFER